jgi:threonylcarbamoyladenosine tRNA methylthiotransferase MtaB
VASFYVENFGCRATQADGASIEQQFRQRGLNRAEAPETAELVVVNTCAVTARAEQDARSAIRRLRRQNPSCQIIVTGCYAQRAPQEVASLSGVSSVVGNSHKHALASIVLGADCRVSGSKPDAFVPLRNRDGQSAPPIFVSDIFAHTELVPAPVFDSDQERTRAILKVQDGCNNRCSFCIIPALRGRSRSLKLEQAVDEINRLVEAGYREVVLSGINLGRWGGDLPSEGRARGVGRPHLEGLIEEILERTPLEKLRISSVEPMDWSESLIGLMARSPRIAKHAHVPMQSGSDAVLRRMYRRYRPWHYREKIERIRSAMPTAAIGADVMTGFPGETESEFQATRRMIEELPLTYLHVFTFSRRPGTPAAAAPDQVAEPLARERNRILRDLGREKSRAFMRALVGRQVEAITLEMPPKKADAAWTDALSDNYLKLRVEGKHERNRWMRVRLEALEGETLVATATG